MKTYISFCIIMTFILVSCSDDLSQPLANTPSTPSIPTPPEWLIPTDLVFDGGPGKDGIPSVDNPQFTKATDIDFLSENDLVLGIRINDEIKAYPHPILDWHEIVNDRIGDASIALTYCPLTGTGVGWDRMFNGKETTFGVSGLLYNTNLMPYDRETNSTWVQQRLDCVNGERVGDKAVLYSFVETKWSTWRNAYPESMVLNTSTGFNRDYKRFPYNDYRTNDNTILFPITNEDNRLPAKDRVLGVRNGESFRAFPFNTNHHELEVVTDHFDGMNLVVARSTTRNFIVAFQAAPGLTYTALSDVDFPMIIEDSNGIQYDLLGFTSDHASEQLVRPEQFMGYWFSWGTFYPDIEIFED